MITLHKIEATNIRSIGHAVFEPLVDGGLTALNGPNGSGKSSLLAAMLWAMYGVTADGVPQSAMRRQGSEGACKVVVEFEINSQMVSIERGLKGRNDSPYLFITVNGFEQAKGSIKAGTAWLVNLLGGLDAEGFMTAFVIRQKELDGLVKAKPAERRKLIERLAGIDRMSTAVKSAREEESEVKKRLDLLPGDAEALRGARARLENAQQAAVESWETYEAAETQSTTAGEHLSATKAAATVMQQRVEAYTQAERSLNAARHAETLQAQAVAQFKRELDTTKQAAQGGTAEDVQAAQSRFDASSEAVRLNQQAREGADRAVEIARGDAARATQAQQRAAQAREAANVTAQQATTAVGRAAGFPADLSTQVSDLDRTLAAKQEHVGALRGEHARITASIKAMEATTAGDSCCPTCSTTLADPTMVLSALRDSQDRVASEGRQAADDAKAIEAQSQALRARATEAAAAREAATQMAERATNAEAQAVATERDAAETAQVARASQEAAETAKTAAMSAAEQTTSLQQASQQAAADLRVAQVAAAAAARVPELDAQYRAALGAHADAVTAVEAAERVEHAARVDENEKAQAFHAYQEAQRVASATETAKAQADGNFRVAEEQVKSAERERDAEEMKMRARVETLALLEQKTAVKEALDFFRKDRIASLAPELSEIATDQIAKMTDGKFTAVELDEEFTPVITDANGQQRPASWLSGGEESAVALALRLAIGEVIAGTQGGLLWMDEPQTAMDDKRRPAMMSVIRDLSGRQPIIISHVTEATDMVDLVLEVVPNEDEGSTVITSRVLSGVDDPAMLDAIA